MLYRVEQKIETLASHAVINDKSIAAFTSGSLTLSHWDFDMSQGWRSHSWLAEQTVEGDNFKAAFGNFWRGLGRIVPRIALICQAYIDHLTQPFVIVREGADFGFVRYRAKRAATGLMFDAEDQQALRALAGGHHDPRCVLLLLERRGERGRIHP